MSRDPSQGRDERTGGSEGPPAGPLSCREAITWIYEFLDGSLSAASHDAVEEHFRVCIRCYPHLRLERSFRDAVRRALLTQKAPESLRKAVANALRADRE